MSGAVDGYCRVSEKARRRCISALLSDRGDADTPVMAEGVSANDDTIIHFLLHNKEKGKNTPLV